MKTGKAPRVHLRATPEGRRQPAINSNINLSTGKTTTMKVRLSNLEHKALQARNVASFRASAKGRSSGSSAPYEPEITLDDLDWDDSEYAAQIRRQDREEIEQEDRVATPWFKKGYTKTVETAEKPRKRLRKPASLRTPAPVQEAPVKAAKRVLRKPAHWKTTKTAEAVVEAPVGKQQYVRDFDQPMRRTKWLWNGMIPIGAVTYLAGPKETGKSQIVIDIAAKLSRGELEGEFYGQPLKSIVYSVEDPEYVVKGRLIAAGYKNGMVKTLELKDFPEGIFSLDNELKQIEDIVRNDPDVKLFCIDPITSVMSSKQRNYDGSDIRKVLERMGSIAEKYQVAFLCVAHYSKTARNSSTDRTLGSSEQGNVVRVALGTEKYDRDEFGQDKLVLSQTKNNLGPRVKTGYVYGIVGVEGVGKDYFDGSRIDSSRVDFCGESDRNVDDISRDQVSGESGRTKLENPCDTWLKDYLEKNPDSSHKEVLLHAKDMNFSRSAVYRSKDRIGVVVSAGKQYQENCWSFPAKS